MRILCNQIYDTFFLFYTVASFILPSYIGQIVKDLINIHCIPHSYSSQKYVLRFRTNKIFENYIFRASVKMQKKMYGRRASVLQRSNVISERARRQRRALSPFTLLTLHLVASAM